jgi:hypothetical protein
LRIIATIADLFLWPGLKSLKSSGASLPGFLKRRQNDRRKNGLFTLSIRSN